MQDSRSPLQYLGGCASLSVLAVCSLLVVTALVDLIGGAQDAGTMAGLIVFFGIGAIGSLGALYFSMFRKKKFVISAADERLILGIAKEKNGVVTVEEVALRTKLSVEQSQLILDGLVDREIAALDVNTKGTVVYIFSGFRNEEDVPLDDIELAFEQLEEEQAAAQVAEFGKSER